MPTYLPIITPPANTGVLVDGSPYSVEVTLVDENGDPVEAPAGGKQASVAFERASRVDFPRDEAPIKDWQTVEWDYTFQPGEGSTHTFDYILRNDGLSAIQFYVRVTIDGAATIGPEQVEVTSAGIVSGAASPSPTSPGPMSPQN